MPAVVTPEFKSFAGWLGRFFKSLSQFIVAWFAVLAFGFIVIISVVFFIPTLGWSWKLMLWTAEGALGDAIDYWGQI